MEDPREQPGKPNLTRGEAVPANRGERWRKWVDETIWGVTEEQQEGFFRVFFWRWLQILDRSIRGFFTNKGPANASALTYTTLLTAVPLLALLLAVLKGFGVNEAVKDAVDAMPFASIRLTPEPTTPTQPRAVIPPATPDSLTTGSSTTTGTLAPARPASAAKDKTHTATPPAPLLTPASPPLTGNTAPTTATASGASGATGANATPGHPATGPPATEQLLTIKSVFDRFFDVIERIDFSKLGLAGFLGMLWAAMGLLSRIERFMNEAWAVHRSRTLARKFADYMNMLVIMLLILVGMSATITTQVVTGKLAGLARLFHYLGLDFQVDSRFLVRVLPYLIVWSAFTFMYFYIPNTRVRLKSALYSGLLAGTLFQVVQLVFLTTSRLASRSAIYGIFGVALALLFWVYTSWCIMLWGAEVCSAHQNLRDWRRRRRQWLGTPLERETLALRMSALLAAPLLAGVEDVQRLDPGDLADLLMLPPGPVGEMIELFQSSGLAVQSAEDGSYLFARAPDTVTVLDILRLVRQGNLRGEGAECGFLEPLVEEISEPLRRQTVRDLALLPLEKIKSFTF